MNELDFKSLLPTLLLAIGAIVTMLMTVAQPRSVSKARAKKDLKDHHVAEIAPAEILSVSVRSLMIVAVSFIVAAGVALRLITPSLDPLFHHMLVFDALTLNGQWIVWIIALSSTVFGAFYLSKQGIVRGEYFTLMLLSVVGMWLMIASTELLTFFIALETMSLAVYVLVGFRRTDRFSQEAAAKYFISGAFASAVFLFGAAFLFGASQSLEYAQLAKTMTQNPAHPMFFFGAALCLAGFVFKIAAVPFHMWAPDTYQGAPTTVTGFMAAGVKVAAFISLIRFLLMAVGDGHRSFLPNAILLIEILAVLSMVAGNFLAILQSNLKRMLAYSSIANAGYLLVGLVGVLEGEPTALTAVVFYLLVYSLITVAIFAVLTTQEGQNSRQDDQLLQRYSGLGFTKPAIALALSILMLALAGIPPVAGFTGKLMLLGAALRTGHVRLTIMAVLASVIGVYYYLRVIVYMYMKPVAQKISNINVINNEAQSSLSFNIVLFAIIVSLFLLGVFPQILTQFIQ